MRIKYGTKVGDLPPKLRELALKEFRSIGDKDKSEQKLLAGPLNASFVWSKSRQGHNFWKNIFYGEEIPDEFVGEEVTFSYEIY